MARDLARQKAKYTVKERNDIFNAIRDNNVALDTLNAILIYMLIESPDIYKGFKTKLKKYNLEFIEKKREKIDEFILALVDMQQRVSQESMKRMHEMVEEAKNAEKED